MKWTQFLLSKKVIENFSIILPLENQQIIVDIKVFQTINKQCLCEQQYVDQ
jgi:hypothetical protein